MEDGKERPVGYASTTLSTSEMNYSQLDRNGLGIIFGVKKFHSYIYGSDFIIRCYHQPIYYLFNESRAVPPMASGRLQRWALTLSGYQYKIKYKPSTMYYG